MSASQLPPPRPPAIAAVGSYTVQSRPTYEVIEGESENSYIVALKQVVRYHPLPGHEGIRLLQVWGPGTRIEAERVAVRLSDHARQRHAQTQEPKR